MSPSLVEVQHRSCRTMLHLYEAARQTLVTAIAREEETTP